jgi:hypothetical protein
MEERTGWRDEQISKQHRKWGPALTGLDIDFLFVEYKSGVPIALIEYKESHCKSINTNDYNYVALKNLGNAANIPSFISFYWTDSWCFYLFPLNGLADKFPTSLLSEYDYVKFLYEIRSTPMDDSIKLSKMLPTVDIQLPTINGVVNFWPAPKKVIQHIENTPLIHQAICYLQNRKGSLTQEEIHAEIKKFSPKYQEEYYLWLKSKV